MKLGGKCRFWCISCLMTIASGLHLVQRASHSLDLSFLFPPRTHQSCPPSEGLLIQMVCLLPPLRDAWLLKELYQCAPTGGGPRNPVSLTRGRGRTGIVAKQREAATIKPFPMRSRYGLVTEHWMGSQQLVPVLVLSLAE